MKNMAKALWPSDAPPESMEGLANLFKGARRRFKLWNSSACREGAREAWAMVKTRFTKLEPEHMARVGPVGPDEQEIPLHSSQSIWGRPGRPAILAWPPMARNDPTPAPTNT